jgi:hypothetical protein
MSRDNRELDALVADKVMCWTPADLTDGRILWAVPGNRTAWSVPPFTTDSSADYLVLKHVRENWSDLKLWDEFCIQLHILQSARSHPRGFLPQWHQGMYEPGDWSKAALKALGEEV